MTVNEKVIKNMFHFCHFVIEQQPDNMFAISMKGKKVRADITASDEDMAVYADALVQASPHVAEVLMVKLSEELQKFEMSKK
jgi:hypothetical protein